MIQARMADVSVVVPCRDAAPFVGDLLDSLAVQTLRPAEVIVVDDGSRDESASVVASWAQQHPELTITIIRQPASGVGAAMRSGFRASRGSLLARADADDRVAPTWIEKLVDALHRDQDVAYAYPAMRMFGEAAGRYYTRDFSAASLVFEGNFVCCGAMMRRATYEATPGVADLPAWEDWDLWLSFLDAGHVGRLVDEELYLWRRHGATRNRLSWSKRRVTRLRIWWRHRWLLMRYAPEAPRLLYRRWRNPVRDQ